ncbi:sensor histidine kinase [Cohnella ginsengisoli]|uniref:histidine kinase n=1 Tax=Cohnella ginsengisoli TaxID=425004 RepID=A0A9X4KG46_9BACL|nr:histidine kinase [Cohnella ginsengisoli]MDG0791532.1 sensor histidine kinase [Cohnella ginsengisoli]
MWVTSFLSSFLFLLFAVFVYVQLYDKLLTQYQLGNQQNMEQQAANLDSTLGKIESLQSIFQNNAALIDYLRDEYSDDRELIYYYLREISPALSFANLADPAVQSLTVYPKYQKRLVHVPGFSPYDRITEKLTESELRGLRPTQGLWKQNVTDQGIGLRYYQKIYSDTYTAELAILEVEVKPALLDNFLNKLREAEPNGSLFLTDRTGHLLRTSGAPVISADQLAGIGRKLELDGAGPKSLLSTGGQLLLNSVTIPKLGLTVVAANKRNAMFEFLKMKQLWVAGALLLLVMLSILYYIIVSSLTKRIVVLSRHMRKVGHDSLGHPYNGRTGSDEIGFLITSYNAMIQRIDELVNRVQKVELLRKEADLKMLQAQIQPHFLYNTLETIRMLSRSNQGPLIGEMAFALGKMLRYSLSKNSDAAFGEEIEHVRSYMAIHQIRMKDLTFSMEADERAMTIPCPRFILQPLVENSIIHGMSGKRGDKQIKVFVRLMADHVLVEVADNGCGMDGERLASVRRLASGEDENGLIETQGTGIGLNNVAQRIFAYYGHQTEFIIESAPGSGTRCVLKLVIKEA